MAKAVTPAIKFFWLTSLIFTDASLTLSAQKWWTASIRDQLEQFDRGVRTISARVCAVSSGGA
jgi:hypothetical protein